MAKNRILGGTAHPLSSRGAVVLAAGVLALAVLLAYANTWAVPFLFDDHVTILGNPTIRPSAPGGSLWSPAAHTGVGGRPFAHLSLVFNYALGGEAVAGYHGVNLAIHLLAGLALFGVVRRTLLAPALAPRYGAAAGSFALAVAGLWLLHPLQTQSVTYVSQRTESLMGLCYLGTLYCFVRGAGSPGRPGWLALSVVVGFAGMASKEVMVTAPLIVLLYDTVFVAGSFRVAWRERWIYYLGLGTSWVFLMFLLGGLGGRGVGFGLGLAWWEYALKAGRAIALYLSLAGWPHPLVFDYGVELGTPGIAEYLCAVLVTGLVILAGFGLRRAPALGFLAAWFFLTLAPTSSVVPIPLQPVAENRVYLPLAALACAVVLLTHAAVRQRSRPVWLALGVALGVLTLARNADYRSDVALWADTVAKRPGNARAHHNLGNAQRDAGRLADAERSFREALRLKPDYAEAAAALGGVLARLGRLDDAIVQCRAALRLDPHTPDAHNNLGGVFWEKGDLPGAIAEYEAAVRQRPGFAEAHANLAGLYLGVGRGADAIAASEAALRTKPNLVEAHLYLGLALRGAGRTTEAAADFTTALRLKPDLEPARRHLDELRGR